MKPIILIAVLSLAGCCKHKSGNIEADYLRHRQALYLIEAHKEFTVEQCRAIALRSLTNDTTIPNYE